MKNQIKAAVVMFAIMLLQNNSSAQQSCAFQEQDGLLVIEAEAFPLVSDWQIGASSDQAGYTGDGYIFWNGTDFFNSATDGIIEANFYINNPGKYTFHWYNRVGSGTSSTDFNDTWFKIVGADDFYAELNGKKYYAHGSGKTPNPEGAGSDGFFKVFSSGTTNWTWASATSDNEGYIIKAEFAQAGQYTMQLAARSRFHLIDRVVLYNDDVADALNLTNAASACNEVIGTCTGSYSFSALGGFENTSVEGYRPAILDQTRGALAIDAALYKDEYAAANTFFNGNSGKYDIRINTLTETDGESSYIILVNNEIVGNFQNPETDLDYKPSGTIFPDVVVKKGDLIQVEFNSHSNGKISEGTSTAYSRGRWTSLELICTNNGTSNDPEGVITTGEIKRWHPVTLTFDGPQSSETAEPNPFTSYRLDVTFTHDESGKNFIVPGYFAACGDAEESSCTEGNKWRVHFVPDRPGTWNWKASFIEGENVATGATGVPSSMINGLIGSVDVIESDKSGIDFRQPEKGMLQYVGEHYLRHSGTTPDNPNGNWFIKAGADATENTMDYVGFDANPNRKNFRKTWAPHQQDYSVADAASYNWKDNKGNNLLGMIRYLSEQGMNSFSFLVFNLGGDDQNVFPHLLKISDTEFQALADPAGKSDAEAETIRKTHWAAVYHDRFDVSKMEQWDKVFSYADKRGMYLHIKLGEEENETFMDSGNTGPERKLFYRELIARFGHHLALNWNIGEENGPGVMPQMNDGQRKSAANFLKVTDPYHHHIVTHSRPDAASQNAVYTGLLGASDFTGASLQCVTNEIVHSDVLNWVKKSTDAGKKWVVCNDEQGPFPSGVTVDLTYTGTLPSANSYADNRDDIRKKALWGALMAGGGGVEYYYGYQTGCGDLDCQDHRTRASKWKDAKVALNFFEHNFQTFLPDVINMNSITSSTSDFVLANPGNAYLVYLSNGGATNIDLPEGVWVVQWYNTRSGGGMSTKQTVAGKIEAPDANDWLALITKNGVEVGNLPPSINFQSPANKEKFSSTTEIGVVANASDFDGTIVKVALYLNGTLVREEGEAPYEWGAANATQSDPAILNLKDGKHILTLMATDNGGLTAETSILIELKKNCPPEGCNGIPRNGQAIEIPAMIQAEDFDIGVEGQTYHDTDIGNSGETCCGGRPGDDVDTGGSPNGYSVAWTAAGEWLEYSVSAKESGNYQFLFDVSSGNANGATLGISVDGKKVLSNITTPGTGDWENYETVEADEYVGISAGEHKIRLIFESGGSNIDQFEVRFINGDYVGINEQEKSMNFSIYPNPVDEHLQVVFKQSFTGILKIIDMKGAVKMSEELNEQVKIDIDTTCLIKGNYVINVEGSEEVYSKNFIKK
ncbi:MAG: DUF5060 domain-containing protein [Prolixibacteraceae bacterium]